MNRPYSKQGNSEGVWLARIRNARAQLSKSEARVADWALAEPEQFVNSPIQHIAQSAQVSQPTVIRFCRSMGCDGLQDLKIKLSGSLSGESAVQFEALSADDSVADIANKVLGNTASALLTLRRRLTWLSVFGQAMHVLPLFMAADVLLLLMRLLLRGNFPGWGFITPGLWCALLWPVVSAVLLLPQRQPPDQDENRPL